MYVGEPKMRMNSDLNTGGVKVPVRLMDIREIDSETLLRLRGRSGIGDASQGRNRSVDGDRSV